MNKSLIIKSAFRSLNNHKIRAILTTLGIIIGVIAIICVMSIGEGAKYKINKEIEKLGTNFIIVLSSPQRKLNTRGLGAIATLRKEDVHALQRECKSITYLSPGLQVPGTVVYERANWKTTIGGVNEHYPEIRELKMASGKFFSPEDIRSNAKVAVLGSSLAKELFAEEDPLGKKVRIRKRPFTIIGVLDEMGKRPDGTDQDDVILVPITTMLKRLRKGGPERYGAIIMSAQDKETIQETAADVRSILRQSRKLQDNEEDDFTVFSQSDIAQASDAAAAVLNLLLFIVASISLIVGGIGIMNIMLVTVTERTREIGIRMAIGATTKNILSQFLLESVTICLAGGLLGALLGIGGAQLISYFLEWPIFISIKAVVISLSSTVFIGVFFGYYPAYQASQLKPVEALIEK